MVDSSWVPNKMLLSEQYDEKVTMTQPSKENQIVIAVLCKFFDGVRRE
jgi:hypothetical protein